MSRERLKDVAEKLPDIIKRSPYDPICNAKGRIHSGTPLGCNKDVNLTTIYKMGFYKIFSIFPDSNWISDIALPK